MVAQIVKNLPAMWETQVRPLGGKDPLEKGLETHSSILAWKIPWTEELGESYIVHEVAKSRTLLRDKARTTSSHTSRGRNTIGINLTSCI